MKKIFLFLTVLFSCFLLFSRGQIESLSEFTLLGEWDLYFSPNDSDAELAFRTLNHEGGLKIKVLRLGEKTPNGQWCFVLLMNGQWDSSGVWFKSGSRFWIYVPDDAELFDCEIR